MQFGKFLKILSLVFYRLELYPFGIECCILEPGVFRTTMMNAEAMRLRVNSVFDEQSDEIKEEYGIEYKDNGIY